MVVFYRRVFFLQKSVSSDKHLTRVYLPLYIYSFKYYNAGAVPKDGPSAGCAITAALTSLWLDRNVRADTSMTGEISLRGSVLPVGGIKSKVLAAHREGIRRVVLPLRNKKDVRDIPDEIYKDLQIVFVDTIEDMLDAVIDGGIRDDTKTENRLGAIADIESANALLSNL